MAIVATSPLAGRSSSIPSYSVSSPSASVSSESSTVRPLTDLAPGEAIGVNAAFLQEIKDSNPPLWHQTHHLRTLCDSEPIEIESPQKQIKLFARSLDELRDLLALQFTLEESYGFLKIPPTAACYGDVPRSVAPGDTDDWQARRAIEQHRRLYLDVVDLTEAAEELQYRGCQTECLQRFAALVDRFLRDLTAHERLESELIRSAGLRTR